MKPLVAALLFALAVPSTTLGAPSAPDTSSVKPGRVDGATASALVARGARIVDVRTADEFGVSHVPGALNIPYDEIGRRAKEIGPPSTPVVVYCRSGSRSGKAASTLRNAGYQKVYDMQMISSWPGPLAK